MKKLKPSGFTIIEVTMATFLLAVGILGVFSVVLIVIGFTSSISSRLAAVYLVQGGIENARNIRDSNWLKQRYNPAINWDDGISTGGWETIDKFQRKITITKFPPDRMVVSAQVRWPERGGTASIIAETELYDWR